MYTFLYSVRIISDDDFRKFFSYEQLISGNTWDINPRDNPKWEGMFQFTRETLQASVTEEGSQNEQQLPGYSALDDAARKIPSRKRKHPEEDDSEVKTQIKSMRILNVFESCLKTRNSSGIYQIIWPNMLMSNFLCILQKRCYRRVL